MIPAVRDPRVDPKPGDVLERGMGMDRRRVRAVVQADGWFDVYYAKDGRPRIRCCSDTWRKWAKTAEIITRAEESAQ